MKLKKPKPSNVGDMIATHILRVAMRDGRLAWYWVMTNDPEPPDPSTVLPEAIHGPFPTPNAAEADMDCAVQEYLGPQCKIEHDAPVRRTRTEK